MGLSASKVRLLQLTARNNDISRELQHLSLQKMTKTRHANEITRDYHTALSSKVLRMSDNNGVTYQDISYSLLSRPSKANKNTPIMLANSSGKIVVDSKYEKYAKMLSPDGSSVGAFEGETRAKIIAELTGISADDISRYTAGKSALTDVNDEVLDAYLAYENMLYPANEPTRKDYTLDDLRSLFGMTSGTYEVTGSADIKSTIDNLYQSINKYFSDEVTSSKDREKFKEACDNASKYFSDLLNNGKESELTSAGITKSSGKYKIPADKVLSMIMNSYEGTTGTNKDGKTTYVLRDTSDAKWQEWYKTMQEKKAKYEELSAKYDAKLDENNQIFTSEQEGKIKFYDLLFTAIAENGWVCDTGVEDNEYLNQMLQNNRYYILTMEENPCYDEDATCGCGNYKYDYEMSCATNCQNIYEVSNSDAINEAQSDYEYKKSLLNESETRIDLRMKNLETEQKSIQNMIDSINKVADDNIQTFFKIFT